MHIRFLGAHNTETKSYRLPGLLLDGEIAFDCGSLTRSLETSDLLRIKNVFLTHQHFDHLRDVLTLAIINYQNNKTLNLYGNEDTYEAIKKHLFNHVMYSDFFKKKTVDYHVLKAHESVMIGNYLIIPESVNHGVPAFGYFVEKNSKSFFYTGDTTIGLIETWKKINPNVLIIEVTEDNSKTEKFRNGPHLTPDLLAEELNSYKTIHDCYPEEIYIVHINPVCESIIKREIIEISANLNIDIKLAIEDLEIIV